MNLYNIFPNLEQLQPIIIRETWVTIKMVIVAGLIGLVFGLIVAICLVLFRKDGLSPNKYIYAVLDAIINLLRALPFVILIVWIMNFTRFLVGNPLSFAGVIVPLVISVTPFYARQIESAMLDVPEGVIEAAESMGASNLEIIFRVYIPEALPGIIRGVTITLVNLLGLTAMVGAVGGGGIGDVSLMYGQGQNMRDIINLAVIIILTLVYMIEIFGSLVVNKINKGEK